MKKDLLILSGDTVTAEWTDNRLNVTYQKRLCPIPAEPLRVLFS